MTKQNPQKKYIVWKYKSTRFNKKLDGTNLNEIEIVNPIYCGALSLKLNESDLCHALMCYQVKDFIQCNLVLINCLTAPAQVQ